MASHCINSRLLTARSIESINHRKFNLLTTDVPTNFLTAGYVGQFMLVTECRATRFSIMRISCEGLSCSALAELTFATSAQPVERMNRHGNV
jgi:hypothetical protein